ncbi:hypothetical protein [Oerskovia paurometabola]|uniref:hypothetical protein n=1 Tax=Oerskovia paurometabola TaxID=162170 RepID=UPI00343FC782
MRAGARGRAAARSGLVGTLGLVLLLLSACSSTSDGVASLEEEGGGAVRGGYADEKTADYADCLTDVGLSVHAETEGSFKGFLVIEGAQILGDTDTSPIGVDGEDRDADIKKCRAEFSGAKDLLDASTTVDLPVEDTLVDDDVAAASRAWAQCARDAGFAMIADPVVDMVVIPEGLTVEQAQQLGSACSRPIADAGDPTPHFDYQAAVKVEGGGLDIAPYMKAIEGPIYANVTSGGPPSGGAPSDGGTEAP